MKKVAVWLMLLIALPQFLPAQVVPTLSLAAWYPLDSNTLDYAAGALHGTSAGTALYDTDRFGNANHCYLVAGNTNFIWLPPNNWVNGNYSVSGWVKIIQTAGFPRLYDFSNGYTIDNVVGKLSHNFNACPTNENYNSNGNGDAFFCTTSLPINTWKHLVYIARGNQFEIWIDAVFAGTFTTSFPPQSVFRTLNKLGGSNAPLNDPTYAYIDDFRVYDRAINYEEIVLLFNEGVLQTGINTIHQSFSVQPNPVVSELTINWQQTSNALMRYSIYNTQGQLLLEGEPPTVAGDNILRLDVELFERGVYYLQIQNESGISVVKWVKI
jgi:Concanavalin A-like lectin/glucanases superfamily/Secretion system C-terminal sorting domain